MPKYMVEVEIVSTRTKNISVYAKTEDEAMEKAEDIVNGWDGVDSCQATNVEEE